MQRPIHFVLISLLAVSTAVSCSKMPIDSQPLPVENQRTPDEPGSAKTDSPGLNVAVVTGGHAFDVPNFYRLFRQLPGVDAYPYRLFDKPLACPIDGRHLYS